MSQPIWDWFESRGYNPFVFAALIGAVAIWATIKTRRRDLTRGSLRRMNYYVQLVLLIFGEVLFIVGSFSPRVFDDNPVDRGRANAQQSSGIGMDSVFIKEFMEDSASSKFPGAPDSSNSGKGGAGKVVKSGGRAKSKPTR